jgi:putative FmdB family regulatory protein
MPIYEYKCRKCGETFDALRSIREADSDLECPVCGEREAERQISLTATEAAAVKGGGCGGGRPGRMRFG